MRDNPALTILIAEDNNTDRMILQTIVRKQGHHVITACDGVEAVEQFRAQRPQLVLLDVMMPRMDGMEAARHIKAMADEELVPIIFLTSLNDAESLAECLEVGGDDFLTKPYNRVILQAKINALNRMRAMHQTVQRQRDHISERNRQLLHEHAMARRVFDNIAHQGCLNADNIRHILSPMSIFNGDVLFASPKPSGGMHVFLGDFTGHGLPAAIGAMPAAEIFYGMTAKGFTIAEILREMNRKLERILPKGFFCCGAMLDLNLHTGHVEVWNGGLPDGYLLRNDGSWERLRSRHLPLGVLPPERFSPGCERYEAAVGERVLLCSDGILESYNARGEMFGEERFTEVIQGSRSPDQVFHRLKAAIDDFSGDVDSEDDLTLVEVTMAREELLDDLSQRLSGTSLTGPSSWRCEYQLRDNTLSQFNPVPLLLHVCMDVPGLRLFSGQIFTILTELFNNALDHGILQLPSSLKDSPRGFTRYYNEREKRLESVDGHWVTITLDHLADGHSGGRLKITVEDSGRGFDYRAFDTVDISHHQLAGRGIALLRQLCHDLQWSGRGNRVEAEYRWALPSASSNSQGPESKG
ncbi:MAG: fused response regulator/phosphatase [Oleiphilaceae bacterium]|nr:fused response regulator/phosphatase [Oleiphilaceae bacterium]